MLVSVTISGKLMSMTGQGVNGHEGVRLIMGVPHGGKNLPLT